MLPYFFFFLTQRPHTKFLHPLLLFRKIPWKTLFQSIDIFLISFYFSSFLFKLNSSYIVCVYQTNLT